MRRTSALWSLAVLLGGAVPAGETVDLLGLIDPVKHATGGTWTKTAEGLVSPGRPFARVLIPYAPPEEYDVTAVVERQGESNALNLGLAVGERQFLVILDAKNGADHVSGLDLVDDKAFMMNETTVKGAFCAQGKPATVLCSVRKGRITVTVDGKKAIDWKADYARLSLFSGWSVARKDCLLVGSWTSVIRVTKLELTTAGGAGRRLADPAPPEVPLDRLPAAEADVRIRAVLARMDAESFAERDAGQKEIERFPVRWLPRVAELVAEKGSPELLFRLQNLGVSLPWAKVLRGTVREALATVQSLEKPGAPRATAIHAFLVDALDQPPADASAFFAALLDSPRPGLRELGLAGLAVFPPPSASRAADFLEQPETCERAADVLIASGDPRVRDRVLRVYAAGKEPPSSHAARVLELLDPAAGLDTAAAEFLDGRASLKSIRLLARAGVPPPRLPVKLAPDLRRALGVLGGAKAEAALRGAFESEPDPVAEAEALLAVRDPAWARDWLAKNPEAHAEAWMAAVSTAGAGARDLVTAALDAPGVKTSTRRKWLPLLGVVGTREDAARLVQALGDPRLALAASEGLDQLGDPAHAGVLLEAWKRSKQELKLGAAGAAEGLDEAWAEVLADPEGYGSKWKKALELRGPSPTPRVREALWAALGEPRLISERSAAVEVLERTLVADDVPRIRALRAHRQPAVAGDGLWLDARSGNASALAELAALLSDPERALRFRPLLSDRFRLLDRAAAVGPAWAEAVAAQWSRRPGWDEGAAWLAGEGDPKAKAHFAARLDAFPEPIRRAVDVKAAARGDVDALSFLLKRMVSRGDPLPEEEAAFVQGAGPEHRERLLAHARLAARSGADSAAVRLAARLADPRGITLYRRVLSPHVVGGGRLDRSALACLEALVRLKAKEAAVDFRLLLRSSVPAYRAAAARGLGELGDRASVAYLVRLVDDPFPAGGERVWDAAMGALEKIDGVKSEGDSVAERRAFWRRRHGR